MSLHAIDNVNSNLNYDLVDNTGKTIATLKAGTWATTDATCTQGCRLNAKDAQGKRLPAYDIIFSFINTRGSYQNTSSSLYGGGYATNPGTIGVQVAPANGPSGGVFVPYGGPLDALGNSGTISFNITINTGAKQVIVDPPYYMATNIKSSGTIIQINQ